MVPMFDAVMFDYVHEADRRIGKAMLHQDALIRLLDMLEKRISNESALHAAGTQVGENEEEAHQGSDLELPKVHEDERSKGFSK